MIRLFLWLYCLCASLFWEAMVDCIDLAIWGLHKWASFVAKRQINLNDIVTRYFSDE